MDLELELSEPELINQVNKSKKKLIIKKNLQKK